MAMMAGMLYSDDDDEMTKALNSIREMELYDTMSEDESEEACTLEETYGDEPVVRLKDGIATENLANVADSGVEFEVIPEGCEAEATGTGLSKNYFESEEYEFSKMAASVALGEEGSSDEENEEANKNMSQFMKFARKKKMEDITPNKDGGVLKRILHSGIGGCAPNSALVRVHYEGYFEQADEPFDSTILQGRPLSFQLGEGEVLSWLDLAVSTMKKNEKAEFVVQPMYAYKETGCPPRIPPNAIVYFTVHLVQVIERAKIDDFFKMTRKMKQEVPFSDLKLVMREESKVAKDMYQQKQYRRALGRYKRAARVLEDRHLANEEEEKFQQDSLCQFYSNIAQCHLAMGAWPRVVSYSSRCLRIEKKNVKSLYRMGKALRHLCNFSRARYFLNEAAKLKPHKSEIGTELKLLDQDIKRNNTAEMEFCRRMFSGSKPNTAKKENEDLAHQQNADTSLVCSPEFKETVTAYFEDFEKDAERSEMPFPTSRFSQAELAYIGTKAKELNFRIIHRGEGSKLQIMIRKN